MELISICCNASGSQNFKMAAQQQEILIYRPVWKTNKTLQTFEDRKLCFLMSSETTKLFSILTMHVKIQNSRWWLTHRKYSYLSLYTRYCSDIAVRTSPTSRIEPSIRFSEFVRYKPALSAAILKSRVMIQKSGSECAIQKLNHISRKSHWSILVNSMRIENDRENAGLGSKFTHFGQEEVNNVSLTASVCVQPV